MVKEHYLKVLIWSLFKINFFKKKSLGNILFLILRYSLLLIKIYDKL